MHKASLSLFAKTLWFGADFDTVYYQNGQETQET
jgi:hypothetical protein